MTIKFEGDPRASGYSVDCKTCFNPFGEEPLQIVGLDEQLIRIAAFQVAKSHEKDYGEDHSLVVNGWNIYSKNSKSHFFEELSAEKLDKMLAKQVFRATTRVRNYNKISTQDYDLAISMYGIENSKTMSFELKHEEYNKAPQELLSLFDQMGLSNEDDIEVFIVQGDSIKLGIEPTLVSQNKLGVLFTSENQSFPTMMVSGPDGENLKYFRSDEARSDLTPVRIANLLEAYNLEDKCSNRFSAWTASNTFAVGLNWALDIIDNRKKTSTHRMIFDVRHQDFKPVNY